MVWGRMLTFALRRLLILAGVVVVVSALTFLMFRAARPERFAGSGPLPVELWGFLRRAFLQGDLGRSWDPQLGARPVADLLVGGLPASVSLVAGALVLGTLGGGVLGAVAALRPHTWISRAIEGWAVLALCAPVYWTALMAVLLFDHQLGLVARLPFGAPGSYRPLTDDPLHWANALVIPWLVLGAPLAAMTLRLLRASLREVVHEDFVRTAHGKGLRPWRVMSRHAVPVAAAPAINLAGATAATFVTNVVLVEQVFNVPGIFRFATRAYGQGDLPVLQGVVIAGAILVVLANAAADLVTAWLDPRLRALQA
jgi:peptide/nickel transport system permease protein